MSTLGRAAYVALVGWWAALALSVAAVAAAGTIVGMTVAFRLLELLPRVAWLAPGGEPADIAEPRWDWRC